MAGDTPRFPTYFRGCQSLQWGSSRMRTQLKSGRRQVRRLLTRSERRKQGQREQSHTFWMRRKWNEPFGSAGPTDARVTNRKMKRIILLEFKRTSDASETYYSDMGKTADTPMATHSYCDGPQRPDETRIEAGSLGGGSTSTGRRADFGQGKGVARVAGNLWDKQGKKNPVQCLLILDAAGLNAVTNACCCSVSIILALLAGASVPPDAASVLFMLPALLLKDMCRCAVS